MISEKMRLAINKQINAELYSAYLYMSMSAFSETLNLAGFANWLHVQAKEETTHAMRFYNHIRDRGAKITLMSIEGPDTEWDSPLAMFDSVYRHECKVTAMINDLVNIAIEERDHASNAFLQWFVNEQVEEEKNSLDIATKLKLIGKDTAGLFMLDQELGARVFVPPADMPGYISAV